MADKIRDKAFIQLPTKLGDTAEVEVPKEGEVAVFETPDGGFAVQPKGPITDESWQKILEKNPNHTLIRNGVNVYEQKRKENADRKATIENASPEERRAMASQLPSTPEERLTTAGQTIQDAAQGAAAAVPGTLEAVNSGIQGTMKSAMDAASPYVQKAAGVANTVLNPAGALVSGLQKPVEGVVNPQAPQSATPPVASPAAPAVTPSSPAPAPASDSTGAGVGMKVRTPGEESAVPSTSLAAQSTEMSLQGAKDATEAAVQRERIKADAAQRLSAAQLQLKAVQDQHAADIMESEQARQAVLQRYENHIGSIQADIAKMDPTINPNRYWQNKSAGQIAAGAIAGALFGLGGNGMQYLKIVQDEVQRDVDAQRATFENASEQKQLELAAANDAYAVARQRGLSSKEAESAAHAAKLGAMDAYIQAVTSTNTSAEALASANQVRAGLKSTLGKVLQDGVDAAAKESNAVSSRISAQAAYRSATANMMEAQAKLSTAARGLKPSPLPEAGKRALDEVTTAANNVVKLAKTGGQGVLDALGKKVGSVLPEGSANEKNYNITKEPIYRYFTGAQTTENEREYFSKNAVPGYSDPFTNRQKWAAGALEGMLQRLRTSIETEQDQGHDVSAYMDQYQQLSAELQKLKGGAPASFKKD